MSARLLSTLLLIAPACLLAGGCPGTTSTDDAAKSVAQFLPNAVSLEINELPEDSDADQTSSSGARNAYQRIVYSAATIVHRFHRLADAALALGATIQEDMTDPTQTQVTGTFDVEGQAVTYKADFAAFDFDGDGTADGSGTAVDLPVAVRIWVDRGSGFERFLCALVTQKPDTSSFGAGALYVRPFATHAWAPDGVQIFCQYDRTGAEHKWNQAYISGPIHPRYGLSTGLARVDVRISETAGTEKTVRGAYQFSANPYGFETFKAAAHYRVGGDALLLSAAVEHELADITLGSLCVDLAEQAGVTEGPCADFDTQDMTLLDVPTGAETAFPAEFPEAPTF